MASVQVYGGPQWLDREPYRFDAKAESAEAGPDQIKLMLRTLLEDRFKIMVHHETQEHQTFTLVVGKNGPKMEKAKDGEKTFGNWTGPGHVTCTHMSILGLANILSGSLQTQVIDETGLKDFYNFTLEYEDPRFQRPQNGTQPGVYSAPSIFTRSIGVEAGSDEGSGRGPGDRPHRKTDLELDAQLF